MSTRKKKQDPKVEALRHQGTLNPRPESVQDPVFAESDFFDPRDAIQVKYEMLRRVRTEACSVKEASSLFGLSRPTYYAAKASFEAGGVAGLLPMQRGPRGPSKLTDEIMTFVEGERKREPGVNADELAKRIDRRFGQRVHPRTVERWLARRKKTAEDRSPSTR